MVKSKLIKGTSEMIAGKIVPRRNTSEKLEEKEISYFNRCNNNKPSKSLTLKEVIDLIKSEEYKEHTDYLRNDLKGEDNKDKRQAYKKKHLPAVIIQGTFSTRNKQGLIKASNYAGMDIDDYEGDIKKIIEEIKKDIYVVCCFVSPSGGLKVIVKIPEVKNDDQYKIIYAQLLEHYAKFTPKNDTSTIDICRLCFLSYDLDLYYNSEAKVFDYIVLEEDVPEETKDKPKKAKKKKKYSDGEVPDYCGGIEMVACKMKLSSKGLPRHTYLDPNVYVYSKLTEQPEVLEEYKKAQERTDDAFNDTSKWKFSCFVLWKYLEASEGDAYDEWTNYCANCKFGKKIRIKTAKELQDKTRFTSLYIDEDKNIFAEQVYKDNFNKFCIYNTETKKITYENSIKDEEADLIYKPIIDEEVEKKAVLLPSEPIDYVSDEKLDKDILDFVDKWLDVSDETKMFAKWNIKRSWVYQRFTTINYLRALGSFGEGKTRFLDTLGYLHYKPIKTSGATTTAPVFRIIEKWKGTLIMDEADFDKSDEAQDMIKIINLGFEKGQQIMRCDQNDITKINFYDPYCPKILATRKEFQDKATESRCITEVMKGTTRKDIPFVLNDDFYKEALDIRNKLLMWRFKNYYQIDINKKIDLDLTNIEPRINQMVNSLVPLFNNENELKVFEMFVKNKQEEIYEQRQNSYEGKIVKGIYNLVCVDDNWDIAPLDIIQREQITNSKGILIQPRSLSSTLKTLGFKKSKIRRIETGTKNCIPLEKDMLRVLFKKYDLDVKVLDVVKVVKVVMDIGGVKKYIEKIVYYSNVLEFYKKFDTLHNNLNNLNTLTQIPLIKPQNQPKTEEIEDNDKLTEYNEIEKKLIYILDQNNNKIKFQEFLEEIGERNERSLNHIIKMNQDIVLKAGWIELLQ